MAIVINGSGTVTGLAVGGLPDDSVDAGSLANSINSEITANTAKTGITSAQATAITAALPKAGGNMTGKLIINGTNTASVTNAATLAASQVLSVNSNSGEGSDNLMLGAMSDGTGDQFIEATNGGGAASYKIHLNPINNGTVVLGGGVAIGGSGAANTLTDYEEGTWTATYTSSGSGLSVNYNAQVGRYVKVGKLVTCTVQIQTSSVSGGSSSHTLRLEGLPFTHHNSSAGGFRFGSSYGWNDLEPDVAQFSGGMLLFTDDAGDWVHTNALQTSNDRNHAYSNFSYQTN